MSARCLYRCSNPVCRAGVWKKTRVPTWGDCRACLVGLLRFVMEREKEGEVGT